MPRENAEADRAMRAAYLASDSTHSIAAQASAAYTILLLRGVYPKVRLGILTPVNNEFSQLRSLQGLACNIEAKSALTPIQLGRLQKTEGDDVTKNAITAQANLTSFLNQLITIIDSLPVIKIQASLEEKSEEVILINHLKSTYDRIISGYTDIPVYDNIRSAVDVIGHFIKMATAPESVAGLRRVFLCMKDLCCRHPKNAEKWTPNEAQWSLNNFYRGIYEAFLVSCSPAEALNLACAALLDDAHCVKSAFPSKDRARRLTSLFEKLNELQKNKEAGESQ